MKSTGHVAGFTSTGSKRPEVLFGADFEGRPERMVRSAGCTVWDAGGREYVDYVMGLGAVALGYGHPTVARAAKAAIDAGVVGPLSPVLEEQVAATLTEAMPWLQQVRFLKSGAEAVAAAIRLARVHTGREQVLGCGYHGWLDWCQQAEGVPASTRALYADFPFNDPERTKQLIRRAGDRLAAVVFEPVIEYAPDPEWLTVLRQETERVGAVLVVDEIKTVCRLAIGGAVERYRLRPDLVVMGKAIANGFPLAAVGGAAGVMASVSRTWISSTLATELVSLAAAQATLEVMRAEQVPVHLGRVGSRLLEGLRQLEAKHSGLVVGVGGVAEMCFLRYRDEIVSQAVTRECARRGLLFKRAAYNFVSLAHDEPRIAWTLDVLDDALLAVGRTS